MEYGPYYRTGRRALETQRRALGMPELSPGAIAAERYGELSAYQQEARSRRLELSNLQTAEAQRQLMGAQTANIPAQLSMEQQRMKNEERAARMAGVGTAIQWSGGYGGGGLLGEGTAISTGQAQVTGGTTTGRGATQAGRTGMTTQGGINTLGSGLVFTGMVTGNPTLSVVGAGMKLVSPVLTPIVNTVYASLFGRGGLLGPGFTVSAPGWGEEAGYNVDIGGLVGTGGLTAGWGEEAGYTVDISGGIGEGMGEGTVICTELHHQGILNDETYLADSIYGSMLPRKVLVGYHIWAIPLTKLMKQSKLLTHIVSWFAIPWAKEMAYRMEIRQQGHIIGKVINFIGIPLCGFIGTMIGAPKYMVEEVN